MDGETIFRFLAALVFVLALIALIAWLARRLGLGGTIAGRTGAARRLRVAEVAAIDAKHRLVLVRRDDVEHLLLLGPGTGTLVEAGIPMPPSAAIDPPAASSSFREHMARLLPGSGKEPTP